MYDTDTPPTARAWSRNVCQGRASWPRAGWKEKARHASNDAFHARCTETPPTLAWRPTNSARFAPLRVRRSKADTTSRVFIHRRDRHKPPCSAPVGKLAWFLEMKTFLSLECSSTFTCESVASTTWPIRPLCCPLITCESSTSQGFQTNRYQNRTKKSLLQKLGGANNQHTLCSAVMYFN